MAVYKSNGVWMYFIRVPSGKFDKYGKEITIAKKGSSKKWKKKDAEREERQFLMSWSPSMITNITFDEVYQDYYLYQSTRIRSNSLRDLSSTYDNHIKSTFGDVSINKLTVHMIEKYLRSLLTLKVEDKPYRNSTIQRIQTYLFAIIRFAIEKRDYIDNTKLLKVDRVRHNEIKQQSNYLTFEQFNQLMNSIEDITTRIIFSMLFHTGMRKGELIGLTFEDVDVKNNTINIIKQHNFKERTIETTKTNNSIRTIVIPEILKKDIEEYLVSFNGLHISKKDRFIQSFTSSTHFDRLKAKVFQEAQITPITWHEFRHSHCATLISAGFSVYEIAERLGDTVDTVYKTYAHLLQSRKTEMMNKYDQLHLTHPE